jgi:hypothetical protein
MKNFKRHLNKYKFILLAFVTLSLVAIAPAQAQEEQSEFTGLTVSPVFTDIRGGSQYNLTLENSTNETIKAQIKPAAFIIDDDVNAIVPVGEESTSDIDFDDYLSIENDRIDVTAGESAVVEIRYIQPHPDFLMGVLVGNNDESGEQVSIQGNVASVIVKTDIPVDELAQISNGIEVKPAFGFELFDTKFSFANEYEVETNLNNRSSFIIKPSGEVSVLASGKRLENQQLTSKIINGLYPQASFNDSFSFTDERSVIDSFGAIDFQQRLTINGEELERTETVYSIPLVLLFTTIALIILVLALLGYFIRKKFIQDKRK